MPDGVHMCSIGEYSLPEVHGHVSWDNNEIPVSFSLALDNHAQATLQIKRLPLTAATGVLHDLWRGAGRFARYVSIDGITPDNKYRIKSSHAYVESSGFSSGPDGAWLAPTLRSAELAVHSLGMELLCPTTVSYHTVGLLGVPRATATSALGRITVSAPLAVEDFGALSGILTLDRTLEDAARSTDQLWLEECDRQIRGVLDIFSLAQGRWIRWSYRQTFHQGNLIHITFWGNKSSTAPVEPTFHHQSIQATLELALSRYTAELRARTGMDIALQWFLMNPQYNEAMLLSMFTSLEHLRHVWLESCSLAPFTKEDFARIRAAIETVIDDLPPKTELELADTASFTKSKEKVKLRISALNEPSFKSTIYSLLEAYSVPLHGLEHNIKGLLDARHKVVHRGLYSSKKTDAVKLGEQVGVARELLRRVFLAMLEYRGSYRSWLKGPADQEFPCR